MTLTERIACEIDSLALAIALACVIGLTILDLYRQDTGACRCGIACACRDCGCEVPE